MDLGQRANRGVQGEMAAQHGAAKPLPRDLDLFGQRDLLLPRQQRNLGHLREVHPHRVVAELGQLALRQLEGGNAVVLHGDGLDRPAGAADQHLAIGRLDRGIFGLGGLGHQLDAQLFQGDQQIVEFFRSDGFVGQIIVDLVVSQISLGLARGDQFLQIQIAVVHLSVPSRTLEKRGVH